MHYAERIFRPPYEANTVLLQATVGCSHHRCRFCNSYTDVKFRVEPMSQIEEDLQELKTNLPNTDRIFLLNADAFVLSFDKLKELALKIRQYLPKCETISMMARVTNVKNKSVEELLELRALGINDLYIGAESGDDETLAKANKGFTSADTLEQLKKLEAANISYLLFYMIGLAGAGNCEKNALATAKLFNQLKPAAISIPSLTIFQDAKIYDDVLAGDFVESSELERTRELQTFIQNLDIDTMLLSHHVTVNTPIVGKMPAEKGRMLAELQNVIDNFDEEKHRNRRTKITSM
ncbi:radical SAM protein [Deltaproteobacteria bacterium OttesenSCG-928-M10]|nr:radical SAM protein [Deltaproteobacteria bacterium OttesenSCG-928-M10]